MIPFPTIPEVENGQTLSAGQLNAYKSALEWLLAESHAPEALAGQMVEYSTNSTSSNNVVWEGYLYHQRDTLYYRLEGVEEGGGAGDSWNVRIDYYGNDSAWHTLVTLSVQGNWWQAREGTVSLASASMTVGRLIHYRIRFWCGDDDHWSKLRIWTIAERGAVTGWATPPTFAATTSSAAQLNTLRTDCNALHAGVVSPIAPLFASYHTSGRIEGDGDTSWHGFYAGIYRYRPERLSAGVQWYLWSTKPAQWRLRLRDTAGREATIYTSPEIQGASAYRWSTAEIDLTTGDAAAALTAAGITLSRGSYYRVILQMRKAEGTGHVLTVNGAFITRVSSGTPAGGWQALKLWAHGNNDVSPANLNKFSTDLTMLYSGGEQLWGECPAIWYNTGMHRMGGRHRKRWLNYVRKSSSNTPSIHYGVNFATGEDLPNQAGWLRYDMTQLGVPWGGAYVLEDVACAFESDEVIANVSEA